VRSEIVLRLTIARVGPREQYLARPCRVTSTATTTSASTTALRIGSLSQQQAADNEQRSKHKNESLHS
jgi:hypothetical protein